MENKIMIIALALLCTMPTEGRLYHVLAYTGFLAANTCLYYQARNGKYQALTRLPEQYTTELRNTYTQSVTQAVYRNAAPLVRWVPQSTLDKHMPQDNDSFIRNLRTYCMQCILHTLKPNHMTIPIIGISSLALVAKKLPAIAPYWYGYRCIATALHAAVALSNTDTLRTYAHPFHTRVYHWCHNAITQNPEMFDIIVRNYCRNHQNNPHIKRWMHYHQPEPETVPLRMRNHTCTINTQLIDAAMHAVYGNHVQPCCLTCYISRPYRTSRHTMHTPTIDDITTLAT